MHGAEVQFDIGRLALIQICGEQAQCHQPPFEQFQVVLHFMLHV